MYGHGLATIALSEAYGLTGDSQVGQAAQGAVNFILAAQNSKDGGWRYNPKDPGDTSVLGWQLTALKSARHGRIEGGSRRLCRMPESTSIPWPSTTARNTATSPVWCLRPR